MTKNQLADEDVLAELPDLIERLEAALYDLRCAETSETQKDLRVNLIDARVTLSRVMTELAALIGQAS